MAPDWFTEQQEEEARENLRLDILKEAARHVAKGVGRHEAIRMIIESIEDEEEFNRQHYIEPEESDPLEQQPSLTPQERAIFNSLCEEYTHWSDLGL